MSARAFQSLLPYLRPQQLLLGGTVLGTGVTIVNSCFFTNAGITYVVQNNLTGTLDVYSEPGVHYRAPFFSSVTSYKQVITLCYEDSASKSGAIPVRFADTYTGRIPVTFRFRLASSHDQILKMHREFRSETNLRDTLLHRNAKNVAIITAQQYTGEEFFQGGMNQYKEKLADQLKDGAYQTERRQVEVEQTDLVPVGADQEDSRMLAKTKQLVWMTVPLLDTHGQPRRSENPLKSYGIDVTQVLIGDPQPEKLLEDLLLDKKKLVADRIRTVQEQETARAQSKTEQVKKDIARTKALSDAQREKELAVIAEHRKVEIERQVAERQLIEQRKLKDLSLIQKAKELEIAKAELDIQKANSDAAIFQAKALAAKGKAEAEVLSAMYRAKGQYKEIYLAEMEKDIANSIYSNLKDFKIEMPHNYIGGSGSGGGAGKLTSNLDVITGLAALGVMDNATAKGYKGRSASVAMSLSQ